MNQIADKYGTGIVYLALTIITLAIFWQVHSFEFINYDDNRYVTENPHVTTGLTFDNYRWAFTTPHFFMWHPVTSLSHMLDCQLFGLNSGRHHLTNLMFHIINALLLFTVIKQLTGAFWSSAFIAALFAVHPLNVESVAWVAERKTVLSGFFLLLTIVAYIRYVKQPRILNYLLVLCIFSLALMSKPTTVTLPFVLLLLDYWPLNRFQWSKLEPAGAGYEKLSTWQLVKEKIPLLLLSLILCILTVIAQKGGNVLLVGEHFSFSVRLANALTSYVSYIGKMFYPAHLSIFYQHPGYTIPLWKPIISLLLLAVVSAVVIYLGRSKAYLAVGWLWFLGTLVPMIGLVQAGGQAMADRYSYIPLIGLFIIVAWGANDLLAKYQFRKIALGVSSVIVISVLSVCTFFQIGYWRNSQILFEHALKMDDRNYVAHINLLAALLDQGKLTDIISRWNFSLRDKPACAEEYNNVANVYGKLGKWQDAINASKEAIKITPDLPQPYNNIGVAYAELGRYKEAIQSFEQAIKIKPDYVEACDNLGITFTKLGCYQEAVEVYWYIVRIKPDSDGAYNKLAANLGQMGQYLKAIEVLKEAIRLNPANAEAYNNLGTTYNRLGRLQDAIQVFTQAIKIKPEDPRAYFGLGLIYLKAGDKDSAMKEYETLKTLDAEKAAKLLSLIQR